MNVALLGNWVGLALWCVCLSQVFHAAFARRQQPLPRPIFVLLWALLLPSAFVLRGLLGELSLAAPVFVFWLVRRPHLTSGNLTLTGAFALAGFVLAASGLGWMGTDVYALGYALGDDSPLLPFALAALLLIAWSVARPLAWAWLIGVCLFAWRLLPSPNVWDVLIDFPSTLLALALLLLNLRQARLAPQR
jgi:hypothetical protein